MGNILDVPDYIEGGSKYRATNIKLVQEHLNVVKSTIISEINIIMNRYENNEIYNIIKNMIIYVVNDLCDHIMTYRKRLRDSGTELEMMRIDFQNHFIVIESHVDDCNDVIEFLYNELLRGRDIFSVGYRYCGVMRSEYHRANDIILNLNEKERIKKFLESK